MKEINYGFCTPRDIFGKLERDAAKVGKEPDKDDLFNFFITAYSLGEWITKYYDKAALQDLPFQLANKKRPDYQIPQCAADWVRVEFLPGKVDGDAALFHIRLILNLCGFVANGSKHFHMNNRIKRIAVNPPIVNFYQFFTYDPEAGLCFDISHKNDERWDDFRYSTEQIAHVIPTFYGNLIEALERHVENSAAMKRHED